MEVFTMEGRRVTQKNNKYNPLFILFLCLAAAVIILLVVSIVLGARMRSSAKKLKAAEEQVQELTETVNRLSSDLETAKSASAAKTDPLPSIPGTDTTPSLPGTGESSGSSAASASWLNLSGHDEVKVKPTVLLDGFVTNYTTAGVNMRSGPATSYDRITTVDYGEEVQVAAREDNWSFVKYENKYGWISSDYLTATGPEGAGSSGGTRTESTSGSIRR